MGNPAEEPGGSAGRRGTDPGAAA